MIRRPPRSTLSSSSAASDVYKRQVMDPSFRYAEHRRSEAFYDDEVFYYQGTAFIASVERRLEEELAAYLGAAETETRLISGQMANTAVFSALLDYANRADPKAEPRRIR